MTPRLITLRPAIRTLQAKRYYSLQDKVASGSNANKTNTTISSPPGGKTLQDKVASGSNENKMGDVPGPTIKRSSADAEKVLLAAYREKFGGDSTATFEDGKPSEMGRGVRNNLFRYI